MRKSNYGVSSVFCHHQLQKVYMWLAFFTLVIVKWVSLDGVRTFVSRNWRVEFEIFIAIHLKIKLSCSLASFVITLIFFPTSSNLLPFLSCFRSHPRGLRQEFNDMDPDSLRKVIYSPTLVGKKESKKPQVTIRPFWVE